MAIPNGATVRQIVPVISGQVEQKRFHDESDQLEYLVAYTDADGQPQSKWFLESQIEVA
jgi:hypothetical protein